MHAPTPNIPETLDPKCGPARDPILRKFPETLYAILESAPAREFDRLAKYLGFGPDEDVSVQQAFDALIASETDTALALIARMRTSFLESIEAMNEHGYPPFRAMRGKQLTQAVRSDTAEFLRSFSGYMDVISAAPTAYFPSSGTRQDVIRSISRDLRRTLLTPWVPPHDEDEDVLDAEAMLREIRRTTLPETCPEDSCAGQDPLFRDHPEILLALLETLYRERAVELAAELDLPEDADVWDVFWHLCSDTDPETLQIALDFVCEQYDHQCRIIRVLSEMKLEDEDAARTAAEQDLSDVEPITPDDTRIYARFPAHAMEAIEWADPVEMHRALVDTSAIFHADDRRRTDRLKRISPLLRKVIEMRWDPHYRLDAAAERLFRRLRGQTAKQEQTADDARQRAQKAEAESEALRVSLAEMTEAHERAQAEIRSLRGRLGEAERALAAATRAPKEAPAPKRDHTDTALRDENARLQILLNMERTRAQELREELDQLIESELGSELDTTTPDVDLTGLRVLLVGGWFHNWHEIRTTVETEGVQLVHDNNGAQGAINKMAAADVVVFTVKYLDHATYYPVKAASKNRGLPTLYWNTRSAESLVNLLKRHRVKRDAA